MLKQTLIAGAALLLAAAPVGAYYHSHSGTSVSHSFNTSTKTVTVLKADVDNNAVVTNNVVTGANSGLNFTSTEGGNTYGGGSSSHHHYTSGGSTTGGSTSSSVSTGDAGAESTVANVVNTTSVSF